MSDELKVAPYGDIKVFIPTLELKEAIEKAMPNSGLLFTPITEEFKWRENGKWSNTFNQFNVAHESCPDIFIGKVGADLYSNKYHIANENITDGRTVYRHNGQFKESKHLKNIVRVAKKTLAPHTFSQIARKSSDAFNRQVSNIADEHRHNIHRNTHLDFNNMYSEVQNLLAMGYEPKTNRFKQVLEYIRTNKAEIDKYNNYDPNHCFVWINKNNVQFKRKTDPQPTIVPSRDKLPDELIGKMAILDISDPRTYIEEVGLKENNNAYWVLL